MSKGFFTDKTIKPSDNDVLKTIGDAKSKWDSILEHLRSVLKLKEEFKFYGINYGWALRFKKNGKSIVSLYPNKNRFVVQIILNKYQVDYALVSDLKAGIIKIIQDKEAIHEGKWIYLEIDNKTDLEDIGKLIDIRIKIK